MSAPPNFKDLTGQRFEAHHLIVLGKAGVNESGHTLWRCRKDSGKEVVRLGWYLEQYCPTPRPSVPKKPEVRPAPEYTAWTSMKQRCLNPLAQAYSDYGGRGIQVHPAWAASYETFLADVGLRPGPEYSLERKETNGHYEPGNVIWATRREQGRNQRSNRRLAYEGVTLTLVEWSERTGVAYHTLSNRLQQGLPLDQVFQLGRRPMTGGRRGPQKNRGCGLSQTPEYRAWVAMVQRCTRDSHAAWARYGGRGITVCERWLESFENFRADLGLRPSPQHSLERKRVNEGYNLDNCCWAVRKDQGRNTRRTRWLTLNGETLSLAEWAERLGVKADTIRSRLRMGWSDEKALSFP